LLTETFILVMLVMLHKKWLSIQVGAVEATAIEGLTDAQFIVGVDGTAANNTKATMSGDVLMTNAGLTTIQQGAVEATAIEGLASAEFIVGTDGTAAGNTAVAMSADATMANDGALTIANNAVTVAKIADDAADQILTTDGAGNPVWDAKANYTATLASGKIFVGNIGGVATEQDMTGDITMDNAGVTTIGATKVTNAMLAGSIDLTAKVTGVLPIPNGGTGSSSQNFVDLTTGQTVAGAKIWSNLGTFNAGITVTGGTVNLNNDATANGVNIGTSANTGTVTIGGSATQSIDIGNGAAVKIVNLGSSNSTSTTTLLSGSGGINLNVDNNQPTNINTGTSTGTVTIGGTAAQTIDIGTADVVKTVNIATGDAAGKVNIGDSTSISSSVKISGSTTINGALNYGVDTGTENHYEVDIPGITEYVTGMIIVFIPTNSNVNTSESKISINGLVEKSIVKQKKGIPDVNLGTEELFAGNIYMLIYNGTKFIIMKST